MVIRAAAARGSGDVLDYRDIPVDLGGQAGYLRVGVADRTLRVIGMNGFMLDGWRVDRLGGGRVELVRTDIGGVPEGQRTPASVVVHAGPEADADPRVAETGRSVCMM